MSVDLLELKIPFIIGTDTGYTFPSLWVSHTTDGAMPKDVLKEPDQWLHVQVSDPAASQRADPYWSKKLGDRFWIRLDSGWQDGTMRASVALKVWGLTHVPWRAAVTPPLNGELKKYKAKHLSGVYVRCENIHNTQDPVYIVTCDGCERPDVFDDWKKLMEVLDLQEEVTK